MGKKKIFISDVHLGAGRYSPESKDQSKYQYDWDRLDLNETINFQNFINYLRTDYLPKVEEVILLGDIFDNWVFPHDMLPPTMEELLEAEKNANVVEELRLLSQNASVFFVPGNHDMHANEEVIKKYFPDIKYCPKRYINNRLIAEHGHRYAMFNAPAGFSDNFMKLPIGYFISRIEATRKAMTDEDDRNYHTYIDDLLEIQTKQTLPQCVLEAVAEEAGLDEEIEFKVRQNNGKEKTICFGDVKEQYRNIYDDWPSSIVSKHRAVFAELDILSPIAGKLCKDGGNKVCILGHSHKSEIDKDTWFVKDRLYANAGYWCGKKCTFVEVEKKESKYDVCLVRWEKDGNLNKDATISI